MQKIREAENDPAKLRELVYEAARLALKRHVNVHYPALSLQDGKRLIGDLEEAIERLEIDNGGTVRPSGDDVAPEEKPPPSQEFNFRAAFEGRPGDAVADFNTEAAPSAARRPEVPRTTYSNPRHSGIKAVPLVDDPTTVTARDEDEVQQVRIARPKNRFAGPRRDEAPAAFETRTFRNVAPEAPRKWTASIPHDSIGSRELVLVPDHSSARQGPHT